MPASLQTAYQNIKQQSKTPIWTFAGLGLVAVLIVIGVVSERNKNTRNANLIASPQKGDVFEIKTADNQYTLYKVSEVSSDSVYVLTNQFEVNMASALSQIRSKGEAAYDDSPSGYSKGEIKEMFTKGEIMNVVRK